MKKPAFYQCGCCTAYHPADWDGDCREDDARFFADELDEKYGPFGWEEVSQETLYPLREARSD